MMNSNVLFANDDVLTQWIMSDVLTEAGFSVVSACRGKQVLQLLSDTSEFDLLLVDVDLAQSAHGDIGRVWHWTCPGRPLIYTGASRTPLLQPLQPHETFLKTPFSAGSLLRAVDTALEDASFRPMIPASRPATQHVH